MFAVGCIVQSHFWLLASAEKFSFCPKNDGFAGIWGAATSPGSHAYGLSSLKCLWWAPEFLFISASGAFRPFKVTQGQ